MDMNGGNPDIHISLDEFLEKGLPLTGGKSMILGTHLNEEFTADRSDVQCARPGREIRVEY